MKKKLLILLLTFLLIKSFAFAEKTNQESDYITEKANSIDSIVFRFVATNPSETKTQTVPIRLYLPREIGPEDISDKGGLELKYDSQRSIYYLYTIDAELVPKQTITYAVRVKDVWIIPAQEIDTLWERTGQILEQTINSDSHAQVKKTTDSIYARLSDILSSQNDEALTRNQHISIYRSNKKVINKIKKDIAEIEKLSKKAKPIGIIERIKKAFEKNEQ